MCTLVWALFAETGERRSLILILLGVGVETKNSTQIPATQAHMSAKLPLRFCFPIPAILAIMAIGLIRASRLTFNNRTIVTIIGTRLIRAVAIYRAPEVGIYLIVVVVGLAMFHDERQTLFDLLKF
jgi:hypothetical protein